MVEIHVFSYYIEFMGLRAIFLLYRIYGARGYFLTIIMRLEAILLYL